jgi:hypothetical protein
LLTLQRYLASLDNGHLFLPMRQISAVVPLLNPLYKPYRHVDIEYA